MARSAIVDPLEKFRFAVSWSARNGSEATALVRLGFHDIQMPKRTTTKGTYREGIDSDIHQLFAGLSSMEDITLSRGILANDSNDEFYKWMSAVHNPTQGAVGRNQLGARASNSAANAYRKDITIQVLDREANVVRQWTLFDAFPVHFVAGGDLNAGEDGEKSIEALTLGYEDFQEQLPNTSNAVAASASDGA